MAHDRVKKRIYCLDGDTLEITFCYDKESDRYFGDYPDFSEEARYTPNGKQWVNSIMSDCEYADEDFGDCGSCKFFKSEQVGDLIGICENELRRKL